MPLCVGDAETCRGRRETWEERRTERRRGNGAVRVGILFRASPAGKGQCHKRGRCDGALEDSIVLRNGIIQGEGMVAVVVGVQGGGGLT